MCWQVLNPSERSAAGDDSGGCLFFIKPPPSPRLQKCFKVWPRFQNPSHGTRSDAARIHSLPYLGDGEWVAGVLICFHSLFKPNPCVSFRQKHSNYPCCLLATPTPRFAFAGLVGWRLQAQMNSPAKGPGTNRVDVPDTATFNSVTNAINPVNGSGGSTACSIRDCWTGLGPGESCCVTVTRHHA